MRRSKSQAVYKFLPGVWVSERDDKGRAVTARINNWNYSKMENIYHSFIENEIKRLIRLFGEKGGDISSFTLDDNVEAFTIVEPACIENVPDILGELSPLVFYCSSCGRTFSKRSSKEVDDSTWFCANCKKQTIKQLQMIYACECGHAEPIKIPYRKDKQMLYRPNKTAFKMFYEDGKNEVATDFGIQCPRCQSRLNPDNAEASRNYKPFTLSIINLIDKDAGDFFEKGIDAQKTVISRWFGQVSDAEYQQLLDNIDLAFSDGMKMDAQRKEAEEQAKALIAMNIIKEEDFEKTVQTVLGNKSTSISVEKYAAACDDIFAKRRAADAEEYIRWINYYSFKLMQYNTVKYAKKIVTLQDSIDRQLEMDFIDDPNDILEMQNRLGIKNMQVSCDMEIITCTYGYTRRASDPINRTNKNIRLKLNAYDKAKDGNTNLVYGAKLETEGVLFEIDQAKIVLWLLENNIIDEAVMPDINDDIAVKKWFADNVKAHTIGMFGEVGADSVTSAVYGLLHTMSHAFIKTIGELSGLSSNSLTEILFLETSSIFIYAQSSQGLPLGAISGMVESNYANFLKQTFSDNRNCIFDPICAERQDTACSACVVIPEVSCGYFNSNLGRKYLYTIDTNENKLKGFWEK
ncbi:hypothetical protein SAMN02910298_00222 [Pseudobutyrivibrio sp. YE44]|uniref:hypothetical protein n=1 Tax=Pseudobutyrivibrio sp. YE44 TaxID=1520802 RepID=UPI00087EEAC9|nr:hypothetical protein [Pseudobutyrivibrio sp. YE44]SDB07107.1 hypothetical protein SAMN02910298_00222 [Pseudobutyrivibrio sp. YE44]